MPAYPHQRTTVSSNSSFKEKRGPRPVSYRRMPGKYRTRKASKSWTSVSAKTKIGPLLKSLPIPFKENMMTRLKYHNLIELSNTASPGSIAYYTYNLNSLWDPFAGIGGAQPRFYDQLFSASGPYLNYRVMGARIKVRFINDNTSAGALSHVGVFIRDGAAGNIASVSEPIELPNNSFRILETMNAGNQHTLITKYVNIASEMNVAQVQDNEEGQAQYNANPVDLIQADVWFRPLDLVTGTTIYADVTIDFVVQCCDLQTVAQS